MKKLNKKGFTLVELLAVIVILGILLLIAVPSVTKIIDNSRRKSFISTAKLVIENVEELASMEKTSETAMTKCFIPLEQITLERGQLATGYKGFVLVNEDAKATIFYYSPKYSTFGTLDKVEGNTTSKDADSESFIGYSDSSSSVSVMNGWYGKNIGKIDNPYDTYWRLVEAKYPKSSSGVNQQSKARENLKMAAILENYVTTNYDTTPGVCSWWSEK